ncbi:MAG: hypothetical protein ABDH21_03985 [bacterium]
MNLIYIGKIASFKNGYAYIRYSYSEFEKHSSFLKVGDLLAICTNNQDRYILGQIVDVYDTIISDREHEIKAAIARDGGITLTEIDIYLFVEVKVKPIIEFDRYGVQIPLQSIPLRLRDVYFIDLETKKNIIKLINKNTAKNGIDIHMPYLDSFLIHGVVLLIGLTMEEVFKKEDLLTIKKNPEKLSVIQIAKRTDLFKFSNSYVSPSLIIGKKLLKVDYDIISRFVLLLNDYLPCFSTCEFYIIYQGVVWIF